MSDLFFLYSNFSCDSKFIFNGNFCYQKYALNIERHEIEMPITGLYKETGKSIRCSVPSPRLWVKLNNHSICHGKQLTADHLHNALDHLCIDTRCRG